MVTIVGAGLVGSMWAVLLKQRGYEVQVYERRSDPRLWSKESARSINLIMTSRGIEALRRAGLWTQARDLAKEVFERVIHPRQGDLVHQPYGTKNECNYSVSRRELNNFLISEAQKLGVQFYFEHAVTQVDFSSQRVTFQTGDPRSQGDDQQVAIPYEVLFATDGAGSGVREALRQHDPSLFDYHTEWLEADYKEMTLPLSKEGKPVLDTRALHIWPRGTHMMMALANLDGSFTVTLYLPKVAGSAGATKSGASFDQLKTRETVKAFFQSEFPDAPPLMPNYVDEFLSNPQGSLGTLRMQNWTLGNLALMGDAAHAIVPFFGQGMNLGFEDCTELLNLVEAVEATDPGASLSGKQWSDILRRFGEIRPKEARAIADMALENWVEMRDKVGDPKFQLKKQIERWLEDNLPNVYKSRYGLITYTLTPYSKAQEVGNRQQKVLEILAEGIVGQGPFVAGSDTFQAVQHRLNIPQALKLLQDHQLA